jgi:hypothetical protein
MLKNIKIQMHSLINHPRKQELLKHSLSSILLSEEALQTFLLRSGTGKYVLLTCPTLCRNIINQSKSAKGMRINKE